MISKAVLLIYAHMSMQQRHANMHGRQQRRREYRRDGVFREETSIIEEAAWPAAEWISHSITAHALRIPWRPSLAGRTKETVRLDEKKKRKKVKSQSQTVTDNTEQQCNATSNGTRPTQSTTADGLMSLQSIFRLTAQATLRLPHGLANVSCILVCW